jgi:hypothetical protein
VFLYFIYFLKSYGHWTEKPICTSVIWLAFQYKKLLIIFYMVLKMGISIVIRNVGGSVAAARAKFLPYFIDPTTAEAVAAWYAASLGKEVGGVSIILEGDSLEVVSALRKEGFCNWVFGPLLDDIKACFSNFLIVDVMHVRREMLIKQLMFWLNVQFLKC